jgi:hypothetical protein
LWFKASVDFARRLREYLTSKNKRGYPPQSVEVEVKQYASRSNLLVSAGVIVGLRFGGAGPIGRGHSAKRSASSPIDFGMRGNSAGRRERFAVRAAFLGRKPTDS